MFLCTLCIAPGIQIPSFNYSPPLRLPLAHRWFQALPAQKATWENHMVSLHKNLITKICKVWKEIYGYFFGKWNKYYRGRHNGPNSACSNYVSFQDKKKAGYFRTFFSETWMNKQWKKVKLCVIVAQLQPYGILNLQTMLNLGVLSKNWQTICIWKKNWQTIRIWKKAMKHKQHRRLPAGDSNAAGVK